MSQSASSLAASDSGGPSADPQSSPRGAAGGRTADRLQRERLASRGGFGLGDGLTRVRSHALFLDPDDEEEGEAGEGRIIIPKQISLTAGSPDLVYDMGCHALQGVSSKMEDRVLMYDLSYHPHFSGCRRAVLVAVLDGHAGSGAVSYLEANLAPHVLEEVARQIGCPPVLELPLPQQQQRHHNHQHNHQHHQHPQRQPPQQRQQSPPPPQQQHQQLASKPVSEFGPAPALLTTAAVMADCRIAAECPAATVGLNADAGPGRSPAAAAPPAGPGVAAGAAAPPPAETPPGLDTGPEGTPARASSNVSLEIRTAGPRGPYDWGTVEVSYGWDEWTAEGDDDEEYGGDEEGASNGGGAAAAAPPPWEAESRRHSAATEWRRTSLAAYDSGDGCQPPDPPAALRAALLRCERELMDQDCHSGSTALVALMLGSSLWLANVGDCRAVVCDDGEARQLTVDHKAGSGRPNDPNDSAAACGAALLERQRLLALGVQLSTDGYLQVTAPDGSCSDIAVSRNLGCAHLKNRSISGRGSSWTHLHHTHNTPHHLTTHLHHHHQHQPAQHGPLQPPNQQHHHQHQQLSGHGPPRLPGCGGGADAPSGAAASRQTRRPHLSGCGAANRVSASGLVAAGAGARGGSYRISASDLAAGGGGGGGGKPPPRRPHNGSAPASVSGASGDEPAVPSDGQPPPPQRTRQPQQQQGGAAGISPAQSLSFEGVRDPCKGHLNGHHSHVIHNGHRQGWQLHPHQHQLLHQAHKVGDGRARTGSRSESPNLTLSPPRSPQQQQHPSQQPQQQQQEQQQQQQQQQGGPQVAAAPSNGAASLDQRHPGHNGNGHNRANQSNGHSPMAAADAPPAGWVEQEPSLQPPPQPAPLTAGADGLTANGQNRHSASDPWVGSCSGLQEVPITPLPPGLPRVSTSPPAGGGSRHLRLSSQLQQQQQHSHPPQQDLSPRPPRPPSGGALGGGGGSSAAEGVCNGGGAAVPGSSRGKPSAPPPSGDSSSAPGSRTGSRPGSRPGSGTGTGTGFVTVGSGPSLGLPPLPPSPSMAGSGPGGGGGSGRLVAGVLQYGQRRNGGGGGSSSRSRDGSLSPPSPLPRGSGSSFAARLSPLEEGGSSSSGVEGASPGGGVRRHGGEEEGERAAAAGAMARTAEADAAGTAATVAPAAVASGLQGGGSGGGSGSGGGRANGSATLKTTVTFSTWTLNSAFSHVVPEVLAAAAAADAAQPQPPPPAAAASPAEGPPAAAAAAAAASIAGGDSGGDCGTGSLGAFSFGALSSCGAVSSCGASGACGSAAGVLIPDPDLFYYQINQDSEFLICACDGLWDVMRNGEACRYVRRWLADGRSAASAAEELCRAALKLGSHDNISCVVLRFSGRPLTLAHGASRIRRAASEAVFHS
ncbi:hypothetical protein PLESTF_001731800 [Pleodorina starrii]|nr:hypothetical protein PLESTM_000428000 [Pleodorina starrii]GLC76075.1 hypothetical protein PLESTF_001731800 [Pleodorina starrii]